MTRSMIRSARFSALGIATLLLASAPLACGGEAKAPPAVPSVAKVTALPPAVVAPVVASHPTINLAGDILAACKITIDNPASAPKFDLDSASVSPEERDILGKLATCLTTGALKGRKVQLIGRADSRGEVNYNMALGAGRAKSVSSYLTSLGVDAGRLKETSRGELDATGTDDDSFRRDRRVDINLAD
jgi:peptidoglycan-associated lipoprotein